MEREGESLKKILGVMLIVIGLFIAIVTVRGSVFFETSGMTTAGEKRFELKNVKELSLETSSIDIYVREADGNELTVELEGSGAGKADIYGENRGDGQLFIEAKQRQRFSVDFNFFANTKLIVYLPESYKNQLSIKTSSGDVTVSGERNFSSLQIVTSSGDVKKLAGSFDDFHFRSSSGDLAVSKLVVNKATFQTSSGDLLLKDFQGELEGSTSSGDARIEYAHANDDVRWNSSSGDLLLQIPEPSYTMELSTSSGDLVIENQYESLSHTKKHYKATVGEGNKQIIVKTSSGDVVIK